MQAGMQIDWRHERSQKKPRVISVSIQPDSKDIFATLTSLRFSSLKELTAAGTMMDLSVADGAAASVFNEQFIEEPNDRRFSVRNDRNIGHVCAELLSLSIPGCAHGIRANFVARR
jgi:hypothetical protein